MVTGPIDVELSQDLGDKFAHLQETDVLACSRMLVLSVVKRLRKETHQYMSVIHDRTAIKCQRRYLPAQQKLGSIEVEEKDVQRRNSSP